MGSGKYGVFVLAAAVGLVLGVLACVEASTTAAALPAPQRRTRPKPKPKPRPAGMKFSHGAPAHQMACSYCHVFPSANWKSVRAEADAFPDVTEFPRHATCLTCHRTEFFARERPAPRICAVCHVAVTPRFTDRLAFPNPAEAFRRTPRARDFESAFAVGFPHASHLELLGEGDTCVTCHTTHDPQGDSADPYAARPPADLGDAFWPKKGQFKTAPSGHAACFSCHAVDSGMKPEPGDCATCHRLVTRARGPGDFDPAAVSTQAVSDPVARGAWRRRTSSATFPHEGGLHTEVSCTTCHDVARLDTTDPMSARVRVASCGGDSGCHVTATVDDGGALNYEILQRTSDPGFRCSKCHLAYAGAPVPPSHTSALPGAKGQ